MWIDCCLGTSWTHRFPNKLAPTPPSSQTKKYLEVQLKVFFYYKLRTVWWGDQLISILKIWKHVPRLLHTSNEFIAICSLFGLFSGPSQSSSFSVYANRTNCFTKLGLVRTKPRLSLETVNALTGCKLFYRFPHPNWLPWILFINSNSAILPAILWSKLFAKEIWLFFLQEPGFCEALANKYLPSTWWLPSGSSVLSESNRPWWQLTFQGLQSNQLKHVVNSWIIWQVVGGSRWILNSIKRLSWNILKSNIVNRVAWDESDH